MRGRGQNAGATELRRRDSAGAPTEPAPESASRPCHPTGSFLEVPPDRLYRVVSSSVRKRLGPTFVDQEDVVQEVLERVFRSLANGSFSGRCSLTTWATAIANRVIVDHLRVSSRDQLVFEDEAASRPAQEAPGIDGERLLEARSALRRIQAVFDRVDAVTAECVLLHDVFECDLADIAAHMGMSIAAVQSRVVRGRKDVHRRLARAFGQS